MKLLLTPHGSSSVILNSLLCIILSDILSRFFIMLCMPALETSTSLLFRRNLAAMRVFSDSSFCSDSLVSCNVFSVCSFSFFSCMRVALKSFRVFPICTKLSDSLFSVASRVSFSSCISFNFLDISSICASSDLFCALIISSDFDSCSLVASVCSFTFCSSAFSFFTVFTCSFDVFRAVWSC